jgi:hypothetical protein
MGRRHFPYTQIVVFSKMIPGNEKLSGDRKTFSLADLKRMLAFVREFLQILSKLLEIADPNQAVTEEGNFRRESFAGCSMRWPILRHSLISRFTRLAVW